MSNNSILFGARIRELRKAEGITQEQLAEYLGIEQKHVSLIECGKSYPSLDRLKKIAEVLHVELPCLFEFMHMENEDGRIRNIEEMLKGLDEESQRKAFRIFQTVIKSLRGK